MKGGRVPVPVSNIAGGSDVWQLPDFEKAVFGSVAMTGLTGGISEVMQGKELEERKEGDGEVTKREEELASGEFVAGTERAGWFQNGKNTPRFKQRASRGSRVALSPSSITGPFCRSCSTRC
jgi:hypothetical protein